MGRFLEGNKVLVFHHGRNSRNISTFAQLGPDGIAALELKADTSTTYTQTEVANNLALKANQSTTYTKTEVDYNLALKANQSTT